MIKVKLTPCASLLYYWIQSHIRANQKLTLDLESFQVWTGEFLEKSASMREIHASLSRLNELGLITLEGTEVTLNNNINNTEIKISPLSQLLLTKSDENNSNNSFLWGLLVTLIFLVLWSCSLAFSLKLSQIETDNFPVTNPFQVLGERFD